MALSIGEDQKMNTFQFISEIGEIEIENKSLISVLFTPLKLRSKKE